MAISVNGNAVTMANGDTFAGRLAVRAICIVASAAGTATTLKNGGSSGLAWFSYTPGAAASNVWSFVSHVDLEDLNLTLGSNQTFSMILA